MNQQITYPVVTINGRASHVLVPIEDYKTLFAGRKGAPEGYVFVPLEVSRRVLEGATPLRAWRLHKNLTQEEVARHMAVSRPAYAQMEKSGKPRLLTLEKAAAAFGINATQLMELYDDEPVSTPVEPQGRI